MNWFESGILTVPFLARSKRLMITATSCETSAILLSGYKTQRQEPHIGQERAKSFIPTMCYWGHSKSRTHAMGQGFIATGTNLSPPGILTSGLFLFVTSL